MFPKPIKSAIYPHPLTFRVILEEGAISSALLDLCIRRVGFTEAIVEGGEDRFPWLDENEFTETNTYIVHLRLQSNLRDPDSLGQAYLIEFGILMFSNFLTCFSPIFSFLEHS